MRMYKMEMEIEGLVCDPLKATHCVKVIYRYSFFCFLVCWYSLKYDVLQGVTAREYIHFFYEPEYKEEWDGRF